MPSVERMIAAYGSKRAGTGSGGGEEEQEATTSTGK